MHGFAGLIDDLGTPAFPASLFRSTFSWAQVAHLSAFMFGFDVKPRTIIAENTGPAKLAQVLSEEYCGNYWKHDLANLAFADRGDPEASGGWILHTSASEVVDSDYRYRCYTGVGIDERISFWETRGGQTLRLNLYRHESNAFSESDTSRIAAAAPVFLALVRRHAEGSMRAQSDSATDYRERLAVAAPFLSPREIDVCGAIILGVTAEGIALKLGIGINTVLTHKKRAYARLRISSQNELMRLVLK